MLITDKEQLKKYTTEHRIWQGIPGIEVTKKGRIFVTFYSGETKETIGNYAMLIKSDDGVDFSEPIAVTKIADGRCYDPCLWIDPLGRLWFIWAVMPNNAVYAVICNNPDAEELVWSEEFLIGHDVMMNKPVVLSTGEWLFPIAVWNHGVRVLPSKYDTSVEERKSFVYKSLNNGVSFERIGGAETEKRSFDEHMILELKDGRLAMFIRTNYGIAVSYSYDRGKTWTEGKDSGLGGPDSRFHIKRLKSGRILLINHVNFKGRNNLTALLSDDECKSWKYSLLLDERKSVSYPDAVEAEDGYIYITYDRERGGSLKSMDDVYACAREILVAKITEDDIMAGKLVSENSRLKLVASKLGKYAEEYENPFEEVTKFSEEEFTEFLMDKYPEEIIDKLFDYYQMNCINMHKLEFEKLDSLIDEMEKNSADKKRIIKKIISLIRSVSDVSKESIPIIERIKDIILENLGEELTVDDIARKIGISKYYMLHLFKKMTGITVTDYKNELKITKAKEMLINSDDTITDISYACGFASASYFSKLFMRYESVSPSQYRELLKK